MKRQEVVTWLGEAGYWIESVAGRTEAEQPHIKKMLQAIEEAQELID